MTPHEYTSGISPQIAAFVRHRMAAGSICASAEENLHLFDVHVSKGYPGASRLTQEMVDSWCARRPTESANSCIARSGPVVVLARFLRERGEADVADPELPRAEETGYVPHIFTDDELTRFFRECDTWEPGCNMAKRVRVRTKRTLPVIFRLLWSSGIRTCEARLLKRDCVDLDGGVLRIVRGKGRNERLVALHPSMMPLMRSYDEAMESIYPGRAYFFPNGTDGFISRGLLGKWFSKLWSKVSDERATVYQLRHAFCIECINELVGRGTDGLTDLEWVSKAMGHTSVEETVRSYYHIAPALGRLMQRRSGPGFDDIMPGVM